MQNFHKLCRITTNYAELRHMIIKWYKILQIYKYRLFNNTAKGCRGAGEGLERGSRRAGKGLQRGCRGAGEGLERGWRGAG